jgi:hypothetical protein
MMLRVGLIVTWLADAMPLPNPVQAANGPDELDSIELMIICGSRAETCGQPWSCRKVVVGRGACSRERSLD